MTSDNNTSAEQWFAELLAEGENDPDFLTEELLLDVTEQIYVRMTALGMRPTDLAERLGVSRAYVSQLLNGKPNMTIRTLVGVAQALGMRVYIKLRPKDAEAMGAHVSTDLPVDVSIPLPEHAP